jgi:hypothetical protein
MSQRFPIRFDGWYAPLSSALLLPPSDSYLEIDGADVHVRMGWAFRTRFPRAAIAAVSPHRGLTISRGVHGFAGRWLVNGSGQGILALDLTPAQRAHVVGIPVRLRQLLISVVEPGGLTAALAPSA